jgi:hypothetical protein
MENRPETPVQRVEYVDRGARQLAVAAIIVAVALVLVGLALVKTNVISGSNGVNGSGTPGKNGSQGPPGSGCVGVGCPVNRTYAALNLHFAYPPAIGMGIQVQSGGCGAYGVCDYLLWLNSTSNETVKITGLSWPVDLSNLTAVAGLQYVGGDPTLGEIVSGPYDSTPFVLDFQVIAASGIITTTVTLDYSVVTMAPPSAPSNLHLVDAGGTWINVAWNNPSGVVTNNTVWYGLNGVCGGNWTGAFSTGMPVTLFNLTGLPGNSTYCIEVTAWGPGGQSWHSPALQAQTRSAPQP